jgi:hypothetical protein
MVEAENPGDALKMVDEGHEWEEISFDYSHTLEKAVWAVYTKAVYDAMGY